jgi:hypothetical protein
MAIVLDGTANTVTPLNGALGGTTPSTVAATTVVASSTIKGATTIAVGNATPSASGAGITFPATQSASTDANTLDDYEEGTWTPTQGSGVTRSGSLAIGGTYTKIGRVVYVKGYLGATVSVTSVGELVSGLPFAADYSTLGGATNNASNIGVTMIASGTSVTSPIAISSTPYIYFAVIYNVS